MKEALEQASKTDEPVDLSGYNVLTDSILHLIMHSPVDKKSPELIKVKSLPAPPLENWGLH